MLCGQILYTKCDWFCVFVRCVFWMGFGVFRDELCVLSVFWGVKGAWMWFVLVERVIFVMLGCCEKGDALDGLIDKRNDVWLIAVNDDNIITACSICLLPLNTKPCSPLIIFDQIILTQCSLIFTTNGQQVLKC